MKRIALMLGAAVTLLIGMLTTGTAMATPPGPYTCTGGAIPAGTYHGLVVAGTCWFTGDTVTVNGRLTVRRGAILNDHAFSTTTARINGNVFVGRGAVLGLGSYGPPGIKTDTMVNGDIRAYHPLSLYLSGITVNGNVVSRGGVMPAFSGAASEFRNFPFKDNMVNGRVVVRGWIGGWIGLIRNDVSGTVRFSRNSSVLVETPLGCDPEAGTCTGSGPGVDSDSSEVMTNVIHGNLVCFNNTPAAQVNPLDGGQPNLVTGRMRGQCADL